MSKKNDAVGIIIELYWLKTGKTSNPKNINENFYRYPSIVRKETNNAF